MITVTGTFTVKKNKIEEFQTGTLELQNASLNTDKGCIEYKFHQLADNPASFFVYEIWENAAAFDAHAASSHFKKFAQLLDGNLETDLDIRVYNAI